MQNRIKYDVTVIGAGIVGLSTAYNILLKNSRLKVLVLEKESNVGAHQTSHNSGVIHSGIYYRPGSLKAINCINGYNKLLDFCKSNGIPFELCGKIIVATSEAELPQLAELKTRGTKNGLTGLTDLTSEEIKQHEPNCEGIKGIHVPQTGIISFKDVALKYQEHIEKLGGVISFNCKVIDLKMSSTETEIITTDNAYTTNSIVNCGGLFCDRIAELFGEESNLRIIPFRGEYYEIKKERQHLVKNLIYPVPNPDFPFLGVHFTRMIEGGVELGPNAVLALKREGYRKTDFNFNDTLSTLTWPGFHKVVQKYWRDGLGELHRSISKRAFLKAAQKLIPDLQYDDLTPGISGVRAQACDRNGKLIDDFHIISKNKIVHVLNAPSPAATSSLSIGENIADLVT